MEAAPQRRDARAWIVDMGVFAATLLLTFVFMALRVEAGLPAPSWLFPLDQFLGAAACAAIWLRRRWPVGLTLVLTLLSTAFELVSGAALAALFTVAVHRKPSITGGILGLGVLAAGVYFWLRPEPGTPFMVGLVFAVLVQSAVVSWGLSVKHRRALLSSWRERAERAETEAALRAEQAQLRARDAIAREMHDVLGHRLSLLSVYAGALEFRPDASPADVARATTVIRENAHQALDDLRQVIGVLRAHDSELPQPTLAQVRPLVEESARAGMHVTLNDHIDDDVDATVGRAGYRIVQEALTNARKHAPRAQVQVRLSTCEGQFHVTVDNDISTADNAPHLSGQGLSGLTERVNVLDGELTYGHTDSGGWQVNARIPLPARDHA